MTDNRGRGRPKSAYNELELVKRMAGFDDVIVVESIVREYSSFPRRATSCANWLWRIKMGDPTGGVHERTAYRFRELLAELPCDPLKPPGGRQRILREAARSGLMRFASMAATSQTASVALSHVLLFVTPIMPEGSPEAESVEIPAPVMPLRLVLVGEAREYVPGARVHSAPARVGSVLAVAA